MRMQESSLLQSAESFSGPKVGSVSVAGEENCDKMKLNFWLVFQVRFHKMVRFTTIVARVTISRTSTNIRL